MHRDKENPNENPYQILDTVEVPEQEEVNHEEKVVNEPTKERTTEAPESSVSFWSRISALPIVHDSLTKAQYLANQNTLSRFALQQAEVTLARATSLATPLAQRYRAHIDKAEALGCRSLDLLEQQFPVVRQPTAEVVDAVKRSPHQVYDGVKDRLATQTSLGWWLQTQSKEEAEDAGQLYRRLAADLKQRLAERLDRLPSKTDLARLADTHRLLQETAAHISKASVSLQEWVLCSKQLAEERVHNLQHSLKDSYATTQTVANQRLHDLTVDLIHRLDAASIFLKDHSAKLPGFIQTRLEPLMEFALHEYDIVRTEALKEDIAPLQKATNIVQLTQAYVLPMLHTSIDGIQEQLRYYTVYAKTSRTRAVSDFKSHLGIHA